MSMVVIAKSSKIFPFHVHWPTEKKKIPDIERTKMLESIICIKVIFPKVHSYIMVLVFGNFPLKIDRPTNLPKLYMDGKWEYFR